MEGAEGWCGRDVPPRFLCQTDAVLPADDATHLQNTPKQLIQNSVHVTIVWPGSNRGHQVDVNVAVARMAEAGNRDAVFLLEA